MLFVVVENERGWRVMQEIKKDQRDLAAQNQKLINILADGVNVRGSTSAGTEIPAPSGSIQPAISKTRPPGMEHIPLDVPLPVVPKLPRGDENADDGDKFVFVQSGEPHSLNYLIEHDAYSSSFFGRVHEPLAGRLYEDLSVWEPHLALAWTKELVCLVAPKNNDAARLERDINEKWDAKTKEKLQIRRITTEDVPLEGDPQHPRQLTAPQHFVRIEISDVNNDYAELLKKDFGDRIDPQWWFPIDFKGQYFMDGQTRITPEAVTSQVIGALRAKLPDFKGRFLSTLQRQDSVVVKVAGDEAARDAVDAALKKMCAAADNKSLSIEQGSVSGKKEGQFLSYSAYEDYLAQEKPIFTFYLRKDVKWDDGEPFTGKDAVFTFHTIMNPMCECGPSRTYLQDIESLKLVDENPYIIRFTWTKPYFNAWSISAGFTPIAEHYYKFDDPNTFNTGKQNQWLVGNGPYKLDKWEHDQRIVFVRNELYYGRKPHVRGIIEKFIKDPAVQLQSFEKGDLDAYGLTPSQYVVKRDDPEFKKRFDFNITVSNSYRYVGWNMRESKFKDRRVRQALTMLIDRDRICKDIYRGLAIPLHGTVHPENPAYNKYVEEHAWPFDPKRAKALLAEAGWKDTAGNGVLEKDGEQFKFTLLIPSNNQEIEATANLIKDSFGQAGIEVGINNLEWKTFLEKIHHLQFDACILGWALGLEFDPYQLWHSSQTHEKESNHCGYVNPVIDRIIEKSRRELNETKRFELLREFQKIILEDQPYTFLSIPKRLVACDKRIHNVQYKLVGADNDRWWVPTAEQKRNE